MNRLLSAYLAGLFFSPLCQAQADTGIPDSARGGAQDFVAAMQRVRQHAPDQPDSPRLQNYLLHDYLTAARLQRDLATNPTEDIDNAIDSFLRAHTSQPVAKSLRREWLASLAKRKRWDWFLPRSIDATEPSLLCERMTARLATGDTEGLAAEALVRWALPQQQPSECTVIFAWLRTLGRLTPELAETRTRAALLAENPRLAHEFIIDVPTPRAAPLLQWLQLLETPKTALALLSLNPATPVAADALLAGFTRLSTSDNVAASSLLPALLQRPDLTPALRNRLLRALALGSAYSRLPGAVAAFNRLPDDPNDTPVQEWRVRAALWVGDFTQASAWLEQMPPALATQPRWRYWRARAIGAVAGAAVAAPLYAEIAGLRDYYGYLAADRVEQKYNLNIRPTADDAEMQASLATDPGLTRAHALFDCDMTDDAGVEWALALQGAKATRKVQAARLASRWGWYAQTIATLAQAGEWDDVLLRYPRPYASVVADVSQQTQVPVDWIYAVMRQESLFRKDAISRADARGLMQMLPSTASAVARRWNLGAPSRDALFEPSIAVKLGALYVHELLDRYRGQIDQALAAYNAGPMAVSRWIPDKTIDADIWIENIPYTETRAYVQHILEHIVAYAKIRDADPTRLSQLLPQIDPQNTAP